MRSPISTLHPYLLNFDKISTPNPRMTIPQFNIPNTIHNRLQIRTLERTDIPFYNDTTYLLSYLLCLSYFSSPNPKIPRIPKFNSLDPNTAPPFPPRN